MLDRLSIRWRLAGISALLTLFILSTFAIVIGELTARQISNDFDNQLRTSASKLLSQVDFYYDGATVKSNPNLNVVAAPTGSAIRIFSTASASIVDSTNGAPDFGQPREDEQTVDVAGYRVVTKKVGLLDRSGLGVSYRPLLIQYGRPLSQLKATVHQVKVFLLVGVFGGAAAALIAGLMLARRAMAPVAALTATARDIARTRDPDQRVPIPPGDDEVAELARTLDAMLQALEEAQTETEASLERQRQFVADASHELRTPLTSVLANLELLAEVLDGDAGEAAHSALRSSQRMRRLVADLLLLARADAERAVPHQPTDLHQVLIEAAAELGPVSEGHDLHVDAGRDLVVVDGSKDELHRLAINLMGNAIRHTPTGTRIDAVLRRDGDVVVLDVADDGPGIDPEVRDRLFERFVRGAGDRGGSSGLGLAIVRAVAQAHGGEVELVDRADGRPGARFVVRIPAAAAFSRASDPVPV